MEEGSGTNVDAKRLKQIKVNEEIDNRYDYARYTDGRPRVAWLVNMHAVSN